MSDDSQLKRADQRRRGRCVSLCQPHDESVEQDVNGAWRLGAGRRGAGCSGRLADAAGTVQVACPDRCDKRLEVGFACQAGVEGLQAPGRAEKQPGTVVAASLDHCDLAAQVLHLGGPCRVRWTGLDGDQQPE